MDTPNGKKARGEGPDSPNPILTSGPGDSRRGQVQILLKEVHMSPDREASSHRTLWVMLILLLVAGLFAFWFMRERET